MNITQFDIVQLIGSNRLSDASARFIEANSLNSVHRDLPNSLYIGSRDKGIDLHFKENELSSIQIFLNGDEEHLPFSGDLPFSIRAGMSQNEVHEAVGQPYEFDEFDSRFIIFDGRCRMIVNFDDALHVDSIHYEKILK